MTTYTAPLSEMHFVLNEIAGLGEIAQFPGYEDAEPDLVEAVLTEAGRLASDILAPLNQSGDLEGAVLENGVVRTAKGFPEAYKQYVENGWNALPFDPNYGGQGLPFVMAIATQEMWNAANMSFGLGPLLTQGAVELLQAHGSDEQKATYLPKMISGEWTGTMNLTESQAGSDVGALKTRAVRDGDHYRITGQKIFITWGEHDCTDNIVHMVLARTPDAPEGTKGISLFIVPKFLVLEDGTLGQRNDLRCVSLEHKLGINASPTCTMAFGDSDGAIGYLVGEENRGMACMFTMMNNARLSVGVQGVAIADRAYQQAVSYAKERTQSRALGSDDPAPVAIIQHPDIRRSLLTMKARCEAMRALAYSTAAALDRAKRDPDSVARKANQALVDLLTPITKGWCTDGGCEVASLGVQVHGGMGFIEETGAAQHYRDARINPIYEGTNGIQALDLLFRKLLRDEGATAKLFIAEMENSASDLSSHSSDDIGAIGQSLATAIVTLKETTDWLLKIGKQDVKKAACGATPYLNLFGTVIGAWLLARSAAAANRQKEQNSGDAEFLQAKITTAQFYNGNILPQIAALRSAVMAGADSIMALDIEQF